MKKFIILYYYNIMMNIVQNVINMYKTDPIKFLLIIAVIYLLLKQSNVIENLKPSQVTGEVNLQALSTVSQLAQKWNNAVEIDNTGNVTFKKNVTNNGTVTNNNTLLNKGIVTINSDLNQRIGGKVKAQLHNGRIMGNHAIFGPTLSNGNQDTKLKIETDGNIKINDKKVLKQDDVIKLGRYLHNSKDSNSKQYMGLCGTGGDCGIVMAGVWNSNKPDSNSTQWKLEL